MSDKDPAYRRAHREKRRRDGGGRLDGGAIAVGLMGTLAGVVALMAVRPPPIAGGVLLAIGAATGGYLTGRTVTPEAACRACHAFAVVGLGAIVAALAGGAVVIAEPDRIAFVFVNWDRRLLAGTLVVGLIVSALGARIGAARKS